jgi:hypothetical protein
MYQLYHWPPAWLVWNTELYGFGISCMTTDNFCFYLQNRLIQTSQTGGQRYSETSPFSIPCFNLFKFCHLFSKNITNLKKCIFFKFYFIFDFQNEIAKRCWFILNLPETFSNQNFFWFEKWIFYAFQCHLKMYH